MIVVTMIESQKKKILKIIFLYLYRCYVIVYYDGMSTIFKSNILKGIQVVLACAKLPGHDCESLHFLLTLGMAPSQVRELTYSMQITLLLWGEINARKQCWEWAISIEDVSEMQSVIVTICAYVGTSLLSVPGHDCSGMAKPQTASLDNETRYFHSFLHLRISIYSALIQIQIG